MKRFVTAALLLLPLSGCVAPGFVEAHGCSVGGPSRDFLFDPPFDVDRGNRTLRELGFDVESNGGTAVFFQGAKDELHVQGSAANFRNPASNWTLRTTLFEYTAYQEGPGEEERIQDLRQRANESLQKQLDWFVPAFEKAYGAEHKSFEHFTAAIMCG